MYPLIPDFTLNGEEDVNSISIQQYTESQFTWQSETLNANVWPAFADTVICSLNLFKILKYVLLILQLLYTNVCNS